MRSVPHKGEVSETREPEVGTEEGGEKGPGTSVDELGKGI